MAAIPTAFDPLGVLGTGGYTLGSALLFSGVQLVDTGIAPSSTMRWELDAQLDSTENRYFSNGAYASFVSRLLLSLSATNRPYPYLTLGTSAYLATNSDIKGLRNKCVVDFLNGVFSVEAEPDIQATVEISVAAYPTDVTLGIGAVKGNAVASSSFVGYIYGSRIFEDGALVQDLVPALDPTGRPCLYDRVTSQPFYAQPLSPTSTDFVEPIFVP